MINCGNNHFERSIRNTNYEFFGIHLNSVYSYLKQRPCEVKEISERDQEYFDKIQSYFDKVFRSLQEIIPSATEDRAITSLSTNPFKEAAWELRRITDVEESAMHYLLLFEKLAKTRISDIKLNEAETTELANFLKKLQILMSWQIEREPTGCFG